MTDSDHRRARCPICDRVCEQTRTTAPVAGGPATAWECLECRGVHAEEHDQAPDPTACSCRMCGHAKVIHRMAFDPSGASLPTTDCPKCETLCLSTPVATAEQCVESVRNRELEEKCTLLSATVRQSDGVIADQARQLREAETARAALTGQLLLTERRASSRPPPSDEAADVPAVLRDAFSTRSADRVRLEALLAEVEAWGAEHVQESALSGLIEMLARYKETP